MVHSRRSWIESVGSRFCWGGIMALIGGLIWAQLVNRAVDQRRINELLDTLFSQTAEAAMTTPRVPTKLPVTPLTHNVRILLPTNESQVSSIIELEGQLAEPARSVWVVVHPLDTSSYWIQPKAAVHPDGGWSTRIFLGRSSNIDSGKKFEIRAIIDPKANLQEGQILESWPEGRGISGAAILERQ